MHGRSKLVGYPVRLIPVTSEIPSRFGAINAIAFRRDQIGTNFLFCFFLDTVLSPTQVLSVDSLTVCGFRYCREVGQLNC